MPTIPPIDIETHGHAGLLLGSMWEPPTAPTWVAVLVHGYGEHIGRYQWVADRLTHDGAVVYGHDHVGHGRSVGERVIVEDFELLVDDLDLLVRRAHEEHPDLPLVLVGHSMGGLIAARYTQRHPDLLTATVLSGPVLGRWPQITDLLQHEEIPDVPISPSSLSRDEDVGEAYARDELVWHGPLQRPTIEAFAAELTTVNEGGRLTVPTLWMHGEDDRLVPIDGSRYGWEQIAASDGRAISYPEARHEIFHETNRDEVLDDLLAFVHEHL